MHIHAKKPEIAMYSRILGVTPQGYAKYRKSLLRPYKYAELLANMMEVCT